MFNLYYKDKTHTVKTKPTTQIIPLVIDSTHYAEFFVEAGIYLMQPFKVNDLHISPPSAVYDIEFFGTFVTDGDEVNLLQKIVRNGSDDIIFRLSEKDKITSACPIRIKISTATVAEQTLHCYIDVRQ